ncbi:hypothetical protein DES53_102781 [Roseimicrobium gellanilyticum]|uniref:Uncharacterized protein n=1 Tax=Roseimicrobium gellanilyticum TaxID=748857 RepID=A0A366HRT3_9BACT|nr:hypothetical protein DES53_102781 [Roseimicrobium gellanilyticum]
MVEVNITDTTVATVGGVAVVGPCLVFGESCSVGAATYQEGYIIVSAGAGTKALPYTRMQTEAIPWVLCLSFVLGLLWARFGLVR